MKFNEYKQGFQIYAITSTADGIKVEQRNISNVSAPYFPQMQNIADFKQIGQNKVVDITIEASGGGSKVYSFPENSSVASAPDGVVFSDREGAIRELTAIKAQSENALKDVEKHKNNIETCTRLLAELDPVAKKDAEVDARFNKIESSMSEMKQMLSNFLNKIDK